jgi:hypothetical protein
MAARNLQNNVNGWRYASCDDKGNPLRTSKLQKGDLTYEMYLKNFEKKVE